MQKVINNDVYENVVVSANASAPTTFSRASSATSSLLLAANPNRKGITIANASSAILYLSYTNPATVANAFLPMAPGSFLAFDQNLIVTNAIYGIWSVANGTAQVTEYV